MTSITTVVINVAGGLAIFLLGMQLLSEGLQAVAGQRLRKMIATATSNRFAGILTGTVVTSIVQSSSVVTVMVVGFVTAGIMTLQQAINVIIGANIGTTVTAWIVSLQTSSIGGYGMIIIALATIPYLFAKKEKIRYTGLAFLGLGLIFYGLEFMGGELKILKEEPAFKALFQLFHADSFAGTIKCITVGAIATAIIQSSSAATAIIITLASMGVINFQTAGALVLGSNIGTTITAWLATLGATTEARRAALAHTLFNCLGVVLATPFLLPVIVPAITKIYGTVAADGTITFTNVAIPVAMMHTCFNVVNTIVFLPFVKQFAALVRMLVPSAEVKEVKRLTMLDPTRIAPVLAVEQARKEVEYMADCNREILSEFRIVLTGEIREDLEQHIFETEDKLDRIQHEVSLFLGKVMTMSLPSDVADRARMLLRVADEYESVSDEVMTLLKLVRRIRNNGMVLSEKGRAEMLSLHDHCSAFADTVTKAFKQGKDKAPDILTHMRLNSQSITAEVKAIRASQLERLQNMGGTEAMKIVALMDVLNAYRKLKETCLNIGEAMLDESHPDLT